MFRMYELEMQDYAKGVMYRLKNTVSKKTLAVIYNDPEGAKQLLDAMNLRNDLIRSGLIDKVEERLQKIHEYNERYQNQG